MVTCVRIERQLSRDCLSEVVQKRYAVQGILDFRLQHLQNNGIEGPEAGPWDSTEDGISAPQRFAVIRIKRVQVFAGVK